MLGSQDAYRRLYQTRSQPRLVAELFLQQPTVPRSILHHLDQMHGSLQAICSLTRDPAPPPAAKALGAAREFLQALPLEHHFHHRAAAEADLPTLAEQLGDLLNRLYDVHPLLSDHYFSHQARLAPAAVATLSETSAAASV
jgi:uncharacterized alpha-E superfamily protein